MYMLWFVECAEEEQRKNDSKKIISKQRPQNNWP